MILRAIIVIALLYVAPPSHAESCDTIVGWVGIPLCAASDEGVAVPDVVGELSFGAADAILGGASLVGLEVEVCSSEANDVVVGQSPPGGAFVPFATVVLVTTSNGTPCKGRPPLWLFLETDR